MKHQTPRQGRGRDRVAVFLALFLCSGVWGVAEEAVNTLNDLYRQPISTPREQPQNAPISSEQSTLQTLRVLTVEDLLANRKLSWEILGGAAWFHNSNIFRAPIPVSDQIIAPNCSASVNYGSAGAPLNFGANYGLSYSQYEKFNQFNGVQQTGRLATTWLPGEKTSCTGDLSFSDGRGSSMGGSVQLNASNLNSSWGVSYKTTEKLWSRCYFGYALQTYGANQSYTDENIRFVNDYGLTSKVRIGISGGLGKRMRTAMLDENDQTVQLQLSYNITEKMSFSSEAGLENRILSDGAGSWQPRFQGGWSYTPKEGTVFGISTYKRVEAYPSGSVLIFGQTLGCSATASQQIFNRVFFSVSGGFETTQRDAPNSSARGSTNTRSFIGPSLAYSFLRWLDGSIFYRATSSRGDFLIYDQALYGIQLSARY